MRKILVTGANGFVGYYLIEQLLSTQHSVVATGKNNCRLPFQSDRFIYESLDFTSKDDVARVFEIHKPEIVVHSGAMSSPDDCESNRDMALLTNVEGTKHLLEQAGKLRAFFIFLSTDFIFDGSRGIYKEEDEPGPVNYYGETKLMAEDAVRQYNHPWAIVRTVLVYGKPFLNRHNILTNTAKALANAQPLKIFNDQVRTPTYVEDLAKGIVTIIQQRAAGIFHLSGKDIMSPYDMANAVAEYLGFDKTLITAVKENEFKQPAKRPLKTGFDISKAASELDFHPVSFQEGLRLTFTPNN